MYAISFDMDTSRMQELYEGPGWRIQEVASRLNWFGPAVRDVRLLRIEEFNDLGPAIGRTD